MDIKEVRMALAKAYTDGNEIDIAKLEAELVQAKFLEKQAQALAAKAEADKHAKARQELAITIHKAIKKLAFDEKLAGLKAKGFTYKLDGLLENGVPTKYEGVALLVAGIPKVGSGKGGNRGKTKDEFGVSLDEVYSRYATEDDKAKMSRALGNSSQWQVKVAVKKRAIADGLLIPVK